MEIKILNEAGRKEAILGIGLSYNVKDFERLEKVAVRLAGKEGHNKFLESIVLWIDVTAPRYWWQEFDTYRIGVTKQSESTMHTLSGHKFTQCDFENLVPEELINVLNNYNQFVKLKGMLPEGFLQRRIVCLNYKVLRHIFKQRLGHRLEEWKKFIDIIFILCKSPEFLADILYNEDKNDSTKRI